MLIRNLVFSGIRSWKQGSLDFPDGFTVLLGPKGSGKSSVIMAMMFALLGDKSVHNYSSLLREGSNRGNVKLGIISNGHDYEIVRSLIRKNNRISQDGLKTEFSMDGEIIARDKSSMVATEISTHLKQSRELIYYTWYVKQESLKSLLDMKPSDRKMILDKLFQFESFNRAYLELRDVQAQWEGQHRELDRQKSQYDLSSLQMQYNKIIQELDGIKKQISTISSKCKKAKAQTDKARAALVLYDTKEAEFTKYKSETDRLNQNQIRQNTLLERITDSLETLDKSLLSRQKTKDLLNTQFQEIFDDSLLQTLQIKNKTSSTISNAQKKIQNEIKTISSRIAVAQKEISDIHSKEQILLDEENCIYCGQPLSSDQAIEFRRERQQRVEILQAQLDKDTSNLEKLQLDEQQLKAILDSIAKLQRDQENEDKELKTILIQIKDLKQKQKEFISSLKELKTETQNITKQLPEYNRTEHMNLRKQYDTALEKQHQCDQILSGLMPEKLGFEKDLDRIVDDIEAGKKRIIEFNQSTKKLEWLSVLRKSFRDVLPTLRTNYLRVFENSINDIYGRLNPVAPLVKVDQEYTPTLHYGAFERTPEALSGGERTELAIAYRIALGNTVARAQTGSPLELLILDEPTENLGDEDLSIQRLAKMLSNLGDIKQIIAVTHDQTFSEYATNVYEINKINSNSFIKSG